MKETMAHVKFGKVNMAATEITFQNSLTFP